MVFVSVSLLMSLTFFWPGLNSLAGYGLCVSFLLMLYFDMFEVAASKAGTELFG